MKTKTLLSLGLAVLPGLAFAGVDTNLPPVKPIIHLSGNSTMYDPPLAVTCPTGTALWILTVLPWVLLE